MGNPRSRRAKPVADLVREVLRQGPRPGNGHGSSLPPLVVPRGGLQLDALMQYRLVEQGGLPLEDLSQLMSKLRYRTSAERTEILSAGYRLIADGCRLESYDGWHSRFVGTGADGVRYCLPKR